jgi:hypothetical protein
MRVDAKAALTCSGILTYKQNLLTCSDVIFPSPFIFHLLGPLNCSVCQGRRFSSLTRTFAALKPAPKPTPTTSTLEIINHHTATNGKRQHGE